MAKTNTARDRAEELLQTLQKRARDLLDAEEGLVKAVRDLIEQKGFTPAEVKKKLEELVGRIKANKLWDRVAKSDAIVALSDYRGEVERRATESVQKLLASLPVANKSEVAELEKQLRELTDKVKELAQKLDARA
jgi:hypothetical protein